MSIFYKKIYRFKLKGIRKKYPVIDDILNNCYTSELDETETFIKTYKSPLSKLMMNNYNYFLKLAKVVDKYDLKHLVKDFINITYNQANPKNLMDLSRLISYRVDVSKTANIVAIDLIKNNEIDVKQLINLVKLDYRRLETYIGAIIISNSTVAYNFLEQLIDDAKLEDSLRVLIFRAFTISAPSLNYIIKKAIENKYYRLDSFKEGFSRLIYAYKYDIKELVYIIKDIFDDNVEKYINSENKNDLKLLLEVTNKISKIQLEKLINRISCEDNKSNYYALLDYVFNNDYNYHQYNKTYISLIFSSKNFDIESLSYIYNNIERYKFEKIKDQSLIKIYFDTYVSFYPFLKANNYKIFIKQFNKEYIIDKGFFEIDLINMAKNLNQDIYFNIIDSLYEDFKLHSKIIYFKQFEKLTKRNKDIVILDTLKNYSGEIKYYYDEFKVDLTLEQAIYVSDGLKSKKEEIKKKITEEFMKSTNRIAIGEYLISCKEDYKISVGKEILKLKDEINITTLKENKYSNIYDIEKPNYLDNYIKDTFDIETINYLDIKKVKYFFQEFTNFFDEHKDYEYYPLYHNKLIPMSIIFNRTCGDRTPNTKDYFEVYPLGKYFKDIFMKHFNEHELINLYFSIIIDNYSSKILKDKEIYNFICKYKLANKYYFDAFMELMQGCVFNMLVSNKLLVDYPILVIRNKLLNKGNDNILNHIIFGIYYKANENLEEEILKKVLYVIFNVKDSYRHIFYEKLIYIAANKEVLNEEIFKYFLISGKINVIYYEELKLSNKYVDDIITVAIDDEVDRGRMASKYTIFLRNLRVIFGTKHFVKVLAATRDFSLIRKKHFSNGGEKDHSLSHILKICKPNQEDEFNIFSDLVNKYKITKEELIRASFYNHFFIDYISKYLNMTGFKMGICYFIAHSKNEIDEDIKLVIKQFTNISIEDLNDGAFDFKWYENINKFISKEDFKIMEDNAKYSTNNNFYKRSQNFILAREGKYNLKEVESKILTSENKDYLFIYSVIPIKDKQDLFNRYIFLNNLLNNKKYNYHKELKNRKSVTIAIENLSRNAKYDNVELFLFEVESINGFIKECQIDEFTLKASFNEKKVILEIYRGDILLDKIPSSLNKNEEFIIFKENVKKQNKSYSRIKKVLEKCMEEEVLFNLDYINNICKNPMIDNLISRLILISNDELCIYNDGKICDLLGNEKKDIKNLYIVHPIRLYYKKLYKQAIEYIVKNNIKQPFKQVFREIYLKNEKEIEENRILRYKDFEIEKSRAIGALKNREWEYSCDIGMRKIYDKKDTVVVLFKEDDYYYTSQEDGYCQLDTIGFINRQTGEYINIKYVDDIVFSETLRDADLMISISCDNTYNYDLALSTITIRQEILKNMVELLHLNNIEFVKDNIKIKGYYGNYIINIRTGFVFKEGVGQLMISTLNNYKKQLLLDFIDEDPLTSDIISKAIVLSDDKNIKDPKILREIVN